MKNLNQIVEMTHKENEIVSKETHDLHDKLVHHYDYSNNHHIDTIHKYSLNSSGLNDILWNQHSGNPHRISPMMVKRYNEHIDKLDTALKTHKTPDKFTVYSGTLHDPRKIKNEQNIVHHPAYLSTSIHEGTAHGFARGIQEEYNSKADQHILKIDVPKGHKGAYIASFSQHPHEKEFILPRGLNLQHKSTETLENVEHPEIKDKYNIHIHHMTIEK